MAIPITANMFWYIARLIHDGVINIRDNEEFSDDAREAVGLILRR